MDAVTQQLLQAKDEDIARLAETVLRLWEVIDHARSLDRETVIRLETLWPEVQHADRTFGRIRGTGQNPD